MPIHDQNCIFSDSQAITASAASTNKVDAMEFLGKGMPVPVNVQVTEDFNNLTSLTVALQQADTENGAYADVPGMSQTIALADLVAGKKWAFRFINREATKKWFRMNFTVTGTAPTTGKVFAVLAPLGDQDSYEPGQYIDAGEIVL